MRRLKKSDDGFSHIEALLVIVIAIVIAGVGFYVYHARNNSNKSYTSAANASTTTKPAVKPKATVPNKTFTDPIGKFSVDYPSDWKIVTATSTQGDQQTSQATLTSPSGTVLNLNSDWGGRGGDCQPADSDKPFQVGNTCPTLEYLSSVKVPINNVYYSKIQPTVNDSVTYAISNIVLTTSHYEDPGGVSDYLIGLVESNPDYPVTVNKPQMGLFLPMDFFSVYNSTDKMTQYIYAYAKSTSASFLTSNDAATVKTILMSLKITI
jgi:hypothetical protein